MDTFKVILLESYWIAIYFNHQFVMGMNARSCFSPFSLYAVGFTVSTRSITSHRSQPRSILPAHAAREKTVSSTAHFHLEDSPFQSPSLLHLVPIFNFEPKPSLASRPPTHPPPPHPPPQPCSGQPSSGERRPPSRGPSPVHRLRAA